MELDASIHDVLTGLWAEYPAMTIRMRDVRIDEHLTVFRATIVLPTGTEVSAYGSAEAFGVAAIAEAQWRALATAISLLGLDVGAEGEVIGAGRPSAPYERADGLARRVAETEPESTDPLNLGPTPSAADVAAATGMRLGARPGSSSDPATAPTAMPTSGIAAPTRPPEPRSPASRPTQAEPPEMAEQRVADARPTATSGAAASPAPTPINRRPRERVRSAAEEEAGVSQKTFWLWAAERGLSSREDVEALLGQSISGMRPSEVRDRILDAEDEADATDD